jgi:MHS family alpha-ketoglutarate permease-like MFS transporter
MTTHAELANLRKSNTDQMKRARGRSIAAGVAGNFIEFYEWTIYAYMAPIFAAQMFPAADKAVSLFLAFSTFALSYVARPLGAILFGAYSDRIGRRNAMAMAILTMGVCSLIIAVTPNYATIGIAAPLILIASRLLQGISAGGEAGSATAYLVEFSKPGRRALAGSFQQVSTGLSTLTGLGTAALLTRLLSREDLEVWGWRIPFFVSVVLSLVGLYLRMKAEESPVFQDEARDGHKAGFSFPALASAWRPMVLVTALALFPTIAFLTWQIFLPTYITTTTGMPRSEALNISILSVLVFVICVVPSAMLSDRFGRRPMMMTYAIASIIWTIPTYVGIPLYGASYLYIITIAIVGNVIVAVMAGSIVACMAEHFDTTIRATGNGLSYAIAIVVSGASFPPVVTGLMASKHYLIISLYVITIAAVSLIASWIMPETRDKQLSRSTPVLVP